MNIDIPEYKTIIIFHEVASRGSVSLAAKFLGLTQSAVSYQISKLETMLNVQLIDRETRPITLTKSGITFFNKCTDLLEEANNIIYSIHPDPNALMPTLRIGLKNPNFFEEVFLSISDLVQHPSIVLMPTRNLINQLSGGSLDIIFCSKLPELEFPHQQKLICRSKAIIVYHDLLKQKIDTISFKSLAHQAPFIDYASNTELSQLIKNYLQDTNTITENFIAVSTYTMCLKTMLRRPSWSFVIPTLLKPDLDILIENPLSYIQMPEPGINIEWCLVARHDVPTNVFNQIANMLIETINKTVLTYCKQYFPEIDSLVEVAKPSK